MSHNVMIQNVKIANVDALRLAIKELQKENINISLNETSKTFRTYYGQPNKCDMTIELPGEVFDVGLVKQPDGTYLPVYDHMLDSNRAIACEWRSGEPRDNRHAIAKLVQRYAVCVTEYEAALQGHTSVRQSTPNGDVQVVIQVG